MDLGKKNNTESKFSLCKSQKRMEAQGEIHATRRRKKGTAAVGVMERGKKGRIRKLFLDKGEDDLFYYGNSQRGGGGSLAEVGRVGWQDQ